MPLKKNRLENCKLYAIVGPQDAARLALPIETLVEEAVRGGADIVQLRDKQSSDAELLAAARACKAVTQKLGAVLIVNDRIEVARQSGADGVHLGQDDASIDEARQALGEDRLVGRSTHSLAQALAAQNEGADYIGVGPIFATPTKPDYIPVGERLLDEVAGKIHIPYFAIGSLNATNIPSVLKRGATRIAVVRAAFSDRDVRARVRALKQLLDRNPGLSPRDNFNREQPRTESAGYPSL